MSEVVSLCEYRKKKQHLVDVAMDVVNTRLIGINACYQQMSEKTGIPVEILKKSSIVNTENGVTTITMTALPPDKKKDKPIHTVPGC